VEDRRQSFTYIHTPYVIDISASFELQRSVVSAGVGDGVVQEEEQLGKVVS
jgi:hypothetical protein